MSVFSIDHDDSPTDVVDKVGRALASFGLRIVIAEAGDGECEFRVEPAEPEGRTKELL